MPLDIDIYIDVDVNIANTSFIILTTAVIAAVITTTVVTTQIGASFIAVVRFAITFVSQTILIQNENK